MTFSATSQRQSLKPEDPLIELSSGTELRSNRFDDIYASSLDPVGESEHVFLNGNQLQKRWREAPTESSHFHIGELGFGTGLNFLLAWKLWVETKDKNPGWQCLFYSGFEAFPLSAILLQRAHQSWFQQAGAAYTALCPYSERLLSQYQDMMIGVHRLALDSSVILDLHIDDATTALAQRTKNSRTMNAWFLDGFSPDRNPELWKPELFALLAKHSTAETTIATYTSAGHVRRSLNEVGLPVKRTKGWKLKRHILSSPRKPGCHSGSKSSASNPGEGQKAIVLGAGLAGSTIAHSLADRGWQVTIMDPAPDFGAGASGIPQLALRLRLFNSASAAAQIYLQAYLFTYRWLVKLASEGKIAWHETQIRQSAKAMNKRKPLEPERLERVYGSTLFHVEKDGSLCFPFGGWVDPIELCRALCSGPNIETRFNTANPAFEALERGWQVQSDKACQTERADALFIASPHVLEQLPNLNEAKIEFTTGVSTVVNKCFEHEKQDQIVTGLRSLFPARANAHLISATYQRCRLSENNSETANQENISAITEMLQSDLNPSLRVLTHYARERANTSDRLPLIGRHQALMAYYDTTHPIYVSSAHGSTGLATCPFAAELIAADMCSEPLPVTKKQWQLLDPSRIDQRAGQTARHTFSGNKRT